MGLDVDLYISLVYVRSSQSMALKIESKCWFSLRA